MRQQNLVPKALAGQNDLIERSARSVLQQCKPEIGAAVFERRFANQGGQFDVAAVPTADIRAPTRSDTLITGHLSHIAAAGADIGD